jgi:tripartite-type tricarboxylate transporter receptor subunit TctC
MNFKNRAGATLTRRSVFGAGLAVSTFGMAHAQSKQFPNQPIEIINMSSPGGGTDIFLRMLSICAREELGTDIVVLSKTGGLGAAMLNYVNNRSRDGHTLLVLSPGVYQTVSKGRTPIKLDELVPLVRGTEDPQFLIAKKGGPIPTADKLLEEGRRRSVKVGGTHVGGTDWVAGMLFAKRANFKPLLYIPFGGGADILTNVIGGNLEVGILNYSEAEAQIDAGAVVPLVVMSDRRFAKAPNTPTSVELGVPAQMATLRGVGALRGVPPERLEKLERAFLKAMECEQYQNYLRMNGLGPDSIAGSEAFGKQLTEAYQAFNELETELRQRG